MVSVKQKLQQTLCSYLGVRHAVLFSSCRNALHTLLVSLQLGGGEVIVQDFICDSLNQAIENADGTVVGVPVDEKTFNLSAETVEQYITPKTKAVLFVHTYGNPTGIAEVATLCQDKGIVLVEDIAHALGAVCQGKKAGTFGQYAVYSFTKQLVSGGGGAVLTNEDTTALVKERDRHSTSAPILGYVKRVMASLYETRAFFLSKILIDVARKKADLKMTNALDRHYSCSSIEAWMILRQLNGLERLVEKRQRNYRYWSTLVKTQAVMNGCESSCNYLTIIFSSRKNRDKAVAQSRFLLPPWPGSNVSEKIAFVPNNPAFTQKKLRIIAGASTKDL